MNTDWQSSLQSLLDGGNLPEGETIKAPADIQKKSAAKLNVCIEKKGRAGKTATIISGFSNDDDIQAIATQLKSKLGCGGSARGCEILIQGNRTDDVKSLLRQLGFKI